MNHLHRIEALLLVPLALLHVLVQRLDRLLWHSLSPAAVRQVPPLDGFSVHQLRKVAQSRGIRQIAGVRTSKTTRQALIAALA